MRPTADAVFAIACGSAHTQAEKRRSLEVTLFDVHVWRREQFSGSMTAQHSRPSTACCVLRSRGILRVMTSALIDGVHLWGQGP